MVTAQPSPEPYERNPECPPFARIACSRPAVTARCNSHPEYWSRFMVRTSVNSRVALAMQTPTEGIRLVHCDPTKLCKSDRGFPAMSSVKNVDPFTSAFLKARP
jgi:hypothetical protein